MRLSYKQRDILKDIVRGRFRQNEFIDPATTGQVLAALQRRGLIYRSEAGAYLPTAGGMEEQRRLSNPSGPGRPRKFGSNAEKQRAYRQREADRESREGRR